jgi:hypothetical protein
VSPAVFVGLGVLDAIGVMLVIALWRLCLAIDKLNAVSRAVTVDLNTAADRAMHTAKWLELLRLQAADGLVRR